MVKITWNFSLADLMLILYGEISDGHVSLRTFSTIVLRAVHGCGVSPSNLIRVCAVNYFCINSARDD